MRDVAHWRSLSLLFHSLAFPCHWRMCSFLLKSQQQSRLGLCLGNPGCSVDQTQLEEKEELATVSCLWACVIKISINSSTYVVIYLLWITISERAASHIRSRYHCTKRYYILLINTLLQIDALCWSIWPNQCKSRWWVCRYKLPTALRYADIFTS